MNEATVKFINENQLASVMNKTKWRELADAITCHEQFQPKVRLKYLRDEDPMPGFSHLDWEWVRKGDASCIEWMDIDPIQKEWRGCLLAENELDYSEFLIASLKARNIPFSVEKGKFRVWGYTSQNFQPQFV